MKDIMCECVLGGHNAFGGGGCLLINTFGESLVPPSSS